jgi:hypothetical protein
MIRSRFLLAFCCGLLAGRAGAEESNAAPAAAVPAPSAGESARALRSPATNGAPGGLQASADTPPPTAAAAPDFNSLLNNSPFTPVGAGAAAGGDKSVEFRGSYTDPGLGATFFSIYDPATQRAAWVGLNETGHPFVVRGYNPANDTLTVEVSGHNLNLTLKHAQVQLAATPKPAPPTGQPNGQPGDANQRGRWMANMTGPEGRPDPQRMQAFIEEMRRRRGARMQNANPDTPGAPGAQVAPGANMPVPSPTPAGPGPGPMPADPNGVPGK